MEVMTLDQIKKVEPGENYIFHGVITQLVKDGRRKGNQPGTASQSMLLDDGFNGKRISVAWKPPELDDLKLNYVGEDIYFTGVKVKKLENKHDKGKPYNGVDASDMMTHETFVERHGEPEDWSGAIAEVTPSQSKSPTQTKATVAGKGGMTNEDQKETVCKLVELIVHLFKETKEKLPDEESETIRSLSISTFIAATGRDRMLCPDFSEEAIPSQKPEDESQDVQASTGESGPYNSPEDVQRKLETKKKRPDKEIECSGCGKATKLKDVTIDKDGDLCKECDDIPF